MIDKNVILHLQYVTSCGIIMVYQRYGDNRTVGTPDRQSGISNVSLVH